MPDDRNRWMTRNRSCPYLPPFFSSHSFPHLAQSARRRRRCHNLLFLILLLLHLQQHIHFPIPPFLSFLLHILHPRTRPYISFSPPQLLNHRPSVLAQAYDVDVVPFQGSEVALESFEEAETVGVWHFLGGYFMVCNLFRREEKGRREMLGGGL